MVHTPCEPKNQWWANHSAFSFPVDLLSITMKLLSSVLLMLCVNMDIFLVIFLLFYYIAVTAWF